jgi:hypothetical protein
VSAHLDTLSLTADSPDRVRISGVRGSPPPATLKVGINELGGWRNSAELVLVGLDIEAKAAWVQAQLSAALGSAGPAHVEWALARTDHPDADTEEAASCRLRVSVRDGDMSKVGKAFTAPLVELALASYPGFTLTGPPAPATPYGVYRPAYVPRDAVVEQVVLAGGRTLDVEVARAVEGDERSTAVAAGLWPGHGGRARNERAGVPAAAVGRSSAPGPWQRVPFGRLVHARSGDKGGDANVGVWAKDAAARPDRVAWLLGLLTPERVKLLLPEAADLEVEVFALPNLGGVNVVIHGLLGAGVAASARFDPQAKALGEWLRSRHVDVPEVLL